MSGCESPPANLRRTKVSQILHGLASDPLTGLLFVAAPCRYPPPFLLLFRIPLRDSSPPAVTPVKVCVPQSQSVVAIFYCWRCTEASSFATSGASSSASPSRRLESPRQKAPCDPEVTWVNQQLRYRRHSVGNNP
ncbi:hypothetical protein CBS63078_1247 [Aspergillus niger]|nr:hypothetical protein CBS115989_4596 [Aspergillus niger]KAI2833909.1 hypothetical protein CBS133816_250 [Aspergillus niger]KAI2845961.1 hypothetical protein CBS11350_4025 [Aspergillus niger]KAI2854011.1 hypothetical protein CBS12448_7886 [Aspergillus niger]KAI2862849.1 hypothetical protein CBS11232_332 [Aspergillus niger]